MATDFIWINISYYYWGCYWVIFIIWNTLFGKSSNGSPSILLPTQMLKHIFLTFTLFRIYNQHNITFKTVYILLIPEPIHFLAPQMLLLGMLIVSVILIQQYTHQSFQKLSAAQLYIKKNSTPVVCPHHLAMSL